MILLHVAPIDFARVEGLRLSIPSLVAAQNRLPGVEAGLLLSTSSSEPAGLDFPVFAGKVTLSADRRLSLPPPFDRPELVVLHSTYIPAQVAFAARLRKAGIRYVICPRGGMTHRSQAYRAWKKRLANRLFFGRFVSRAAALHCLTEAEADESRQWNRPIVVAGNGIEIPAEEQLPLESPTQPLRVVFLGRVAPVHKGLDLLLQACATVRDAMRQRDARLEIHGPDWRGSVRQLARMIDDSRLGELVRLCGPADGARKEALFRTASVFVHTSRWEGHPMAVLEALARGVPCLLTPGTNMDAEVAEAGAGWSVEPSVSGIAGGLRAIFALSAEELQTMRRNARRLAIAQFDWASVARHTTEAYRPYAA